MSAKLLFVGGLFLAVYGLIAYRAVRSPLLARLAAREAIRRRSQTVLVVAGLMVGSAAVAAALVGADSAHDSALANAYRSWGMTDILVSAGEHQFPFDTASRLGDDPRLTQLLDGVQGGLELVGSVSNLDRRQSESGIRLIGFDPVTQEPFGPYVLLDGTRAFGGDLGPGEVLLSRQLADALDAQIGDTLRVAVEQGIPSPPIDLRVAGIARSEGPGAYGLTASVFAQLETAQRIAGTQMINVVRLSASGGLESGLDGANRAVDAVRDAVAGLSSPVPLDVREVKEAEVQAAEKNTQFTFAMLVGMSVLVLAAGVALVINLTMMLAEERRPRLAVLRALGLTRKGLVSLSVFEGALYSLAAAAVGTGVGLFAGRILAARFGVAFAEFFGAAVDYRFVFVLNPATLAVAFAAGSLITLGTLFLAARRTSKLSIPAAIRNLPEPAHELRKRRWPIVVRGLLLLGGIVAVASGDRLGLLVGGYAIVVVAAFFARDRMPDQLRVTLFGGSLAAWSFYMVRSINSEADPNKFFQLFTVAVLVAVIGLTLVASANLRMIEPLSGILGSVWRRLRALLRPPLAYLARRPLRTGLSMSMFALVMAIISMFSVFLSILRPQYERDTVGYDVVATASGTAAIRLPASIEDDVVRQAAITTRGYVGPLASAFQNLESIFVPLYALTPAQLGDPPLHFSTRAAQFDSDAAAWAKVASDPTWVVCTFSQPGDTITLQGGNGPVTLHVAANPANGMFRGVTGSEEALKPFASAPVGETLLVDLKPGVDAGRTARQIEQALFADGVNAGTTRSQLDDGYRANRTFFSVIDVLMRMGLVVGILSLGILALRSVVERRHIIGVLRAIGYKRGGVMFGLMVEAGVTTSLGVLVGCSAGLTMGFLFFRAFSPESSFGVDWPTLVSALALVYGAVVLVTLGPSWRASRLPPAEAVRYRE